MRAFVVCMYVFIYVCITGDSEVANTWKHILSSVADTRSASRYLTRRFIVVFTMDPTLGQLKPVRASR
jgi:hypothetical protein